MAQSPTGRRGRLFVVSAPSGAGKTSLTHAVIERLAARGPAPRFSVSYTTRAPRGGERNGVDYHFVGVKRFAEMVAGRQFLEYARVFGQCYGTGRAETERWMAAGHDVVLDIDWQGARQIRAAAPDAISVFIKAPSRAELERRLRARALDDEATIARRLAAAQEDMAHAHEYDHVVINDAFTAALGRLEGIFAGAASGNPVD